MRRLAAIVLSVWFLSTMLLAVIGAVRLLAGAP